MAKNTYWWKVVYCLVLKEYFENHAEILLSDKSVRSLLSDIYTNDQLRINLMMAAYNSGIVTDMRRIFPVDQFTVTRWAKKLVMDFGISDHKAHLSYGKKPEFTVYNTEAAQQII